MAGYDEMIRLSIKAVCVTLAAIHTHAHTNQWIHVLLWLCLITLAQSDTWKSRSGRNEALVFQSVMSHFFQHVPQRFKNKGSTWRQHSVPHRSLHCFKVCKERWGTRCEVEMLFHFNLCSSKMLPYPETLFHFSNVLKLTHSAFILSNFFNFIIISTDCTRSRWRWVDTNSLSLIIYHF